MVKNPKNKASIKLIYNPHAGLKRKIFKSLTTLEDVHLLLKQYQIEFDSYPTKHPGHATELAKDASKEGYRTVLVAGGDGTVGEVVQGLVGSDLTLGILPMGSFMNIALMLGIPNELEKAVLLIKVGRTRKIDLGTITRFSGDKLDNPNYFLESVGIGLEAQLQENFLQLEQGSKSAVFKIFKTLFEYYGHRAKITLNDKKVIKTRATMVTISNGPYTGANIPLAPNAKLNDHRLTLRLFRMSKLELFLYFLNLTQRGVRYSTKIQTFQAKKVKVETRHPRMVHADARTYGTTPITLSIAPSSLNVITGFPTKKDSSLIKRTYLDP